MQELGHAVSVAQVPGTIASYGGQAIDVIKSDDKAQPQVNFDLLLADMAGSFGTQLAELQENDDYFGSSDFDWSAARSKTITSIITSIMEQADAIISDKVINTHFPTSSHGFGISEELFKDIRGYIVMDLTQQIQKELDPQLLAKDVPLLVKTDLPGNQEQPGGPDIESETETFADHEQEAAYPGTKGVAIIHTGRSHQRPSGHNQEVRRKLD